MHDSGRDSLFLPAGRGGSGADFRTTQFRIATYAELEDFQQVFPYFLVELFTQNEARVDIFGGIDDQSANIDPVLLFEGRAGRCQRIEKHHAVATNFRSATGPAMDTGFRI